MDGSVTLPTRHETTLRRTCSRTHPSYRTPNRGQEERGAAIRKSKPKPKFGHQFGLRRNNLGHFDSNYRVTELTEKTEVLAHQQILTHHMSKFQPGP
jgi:hypothetical protein